MRKYDSYKDSGVEWIGEIPSGWRKSKFKYVSELQTGNSLNDEQKQLYESDNPEEIPYVSSKDIDVDFKTVNYDNGLRIPREDNRFRVSPKGSFLMVIEGGSSGRKMVFLDKEVCYVNKLCSFHSKENTKFQYYFVQSNNYQDKFRTSLSGLIGGVSISNLREFELPLPPLSEQQQIVSFLDTKTSQIDSLIEKTQRKIELLKEKRTSLINEVVTKGLNPNVEMKDSGVEWIGEIPSHWERKKIKTISLLISKGTTPSTIGKEVSNEGEIRYLKSENIVDNSISDFPRFFIDNETNEILKRSILVEGDILFVIAGASIGKTTILPKEYSPSNTNQAVSFIRLKQNENNKFIWFWLISSKIQEQMWVVAVQSAQPNLSMENLGNFYIPYPPKKEQNEIVSYLDEHTKLIDKTISIEEKRIELLKEYRQSLISEVVTGKRKVVN